MARQPLAIESSPRVGPTFSSWAGVGIRLAGRLARLEDLDQVLDFLGLEPLSASLDDPLVADLGVDRRGRHHQVIQKNRKLIFKCVSLFGKVLASELAEPPGSLAVEVEPDSRLKPFIRGGVRPREVASGHVLTIENAEDVNLRSPR